MMPRNAPKNNYHLIPYDISSKGIFDSLDGIAPMGYSQKQEEMIWWNGGFRSREPWIGNTANDDLVSLSDISGNGTAYTAVGHHRGYVESQSGKVMVFKEHILYSDDPTEVGYTHAGDSGEITALPGTETEFLGAVYFANYFLIYTANRLYTLDMSDGSLTEAVNFAVDIGADYGPIVGMFTRFGQIWTISEEDRIFWSDTREYAFGEGAVDVQPIDIIWDWQYITNGPISENAGVSVEYRYLADIIIAPYEGFALKNGRNYFFGTNVAPNSNVQTGKVVFDSSDTEYTINFLSSKKYEWDLSVRYQPGVTLPDSVVTIADTYDIFKECIYGSPVSYNGVVLLGEGYHGIGKLVTISDGTNTDTFEISNIVFHTDPDKGVDLYIQGGAALSNTFEIANTTITVASFSKYYLTAAPPADVETDLAHVEYSQVVNPSNYTVSYDPANDDNADGHIKMEYKMSYAGTYKTNEIFYVTFTPYVNPWLEGNSGFVDIASDKGENITYVEGPSKEEDEGASMFYVFKTDAIYAVMGKPGIDGTVGTLDIKNIAYGIKALPRTPRVTQNGVYFCELSGSELNTRFFPHGVILSDQVPSIARHVDFMLNSDLTKMGKTFSEIGSDLEIATEILDGDKYIMKISSAVTGPDSVPIDTDCIYVCQAHRTQQGAYVGRWARWNEIQEATIDPLFLTDTLMKPHTVGFYRQQGSLMRVYAIETPYAKINDTTHCVWGIARYGTNPYISTYQSEGKDTDLLHLNFIASTSGQIERRDNNIRPLLLGSMTQLAKKINIKKVHVNAEHHIPVSGNTGVKLTLDVFKDLDTTSIFGGALEVSNLTDDSNPPRKPELTGINFNCKYFQFLIYWDDVVSTAGGNNNDAFVFLRTLLLKTAILSGNRYDVDGVTDFD
jgi:hypothetical protein